MALSFGAFCTDSCAVPITCFRFSNFEASCWPVERNFEARGASYRYPGARADAVAEAKEHIASRNLYGQISAETYDGENLPFGDNIVNLVIVENAAQVTAA